MNKRILWITFSAIAILLISLASAPLTQIADNVTFVVLDSYGNPLDGVTVSYNDYSNHWVTLGTTAGSNPVYATYADGTYRFKAVKDNTEQVADVIVSGTGSHIFQTSEFVVHVTDSAGTDYSGIAVSFNDYGIHYLSMGNTDANGKASIELFPGAHKLRAYKDHTDVTGDLTNNTEGTSATIDFQTAKFTVHVTDSDGFDFPGIDTSFNDYGTHYLGMGKTDTNGKASIELFPGTYEFRAYKDHTDVTGDLTNGVAGIESTIDFQTAKAIGVVKDCDGTPLPGFKVEFNDYGAHWLNMGTTGVDGKASIELFPGIRTIRALIDYTYEVKDLNLTLTESTVELNPTKVNFIFSGTVKYNDYGSHWKTMISPFYLFPGTYTFMFDDVLQEIAISGCTLNYPIGNEPPVADSGGPYSGDEGSPISLDGTGSSDPEGDPLTYSWGVDSSLCSFDDASVLNPNLICSDNGNFTATLTVSDGVNPAVSSYTSVTVDNLAPTAVSLAPTTPDPVVGINTPVTFDATFTDPAGAVDEEYTCSFDWDGDGAVDDNVTASYGSCDGVASYSTPGVYIVKFMVIDKDGGVSNVIEYQFVVVYDPSGGFVTGGGWFVSPAGAYKADETLTGKATFGFVAKYKKGANVPDGNTEFQFKAGDLNFHSTSYEWLVVAGNKAQFKGEGTINGAGSYKFMIFADDDSPDTFRIQIWGDIGTVYDNGSQQGLGGGSIVVHK